MVPETSPPRILGLDIGNRRIGIAITDELGITVQPLLTLGRSTLRHDLKSIGRILRKHNVTSIIAGNPLHMSGDASPQSEKTRTFLIALQAELGVPVTLWDERLTSQAANELLDEQGYPRGAGRRAIIDQVAAVVILQSYLEAPERERQAATCVAAV